MSYRILIVEDVPEMREYLSQVLIRVLPGSSIQTAGSSAEFFRVAERSKPDVVFLDEVLGIGEDLSGIIERAQQMMTRVVIVTGVLASSRQHAALPGGVLGRVEKPSWDSGEGEKEFAVQVLRLLRA